MKRGTISIIVVAILTLFSGYASAAPLQSKIPTFSITNVKVDTSVTIQTYNFPAGEGFDVLMGYMGTRGINGFFVESINTGNGGTFSDTYTIPDQLKGEYQISIRLQSNTGKGYFAYNWFYNNTSSGRPKPPPGGGTGYLGIPTFTISAVVRDENVSIITHNFPNNDNFDVLMNYMGTRGVNGILVDTVSSGSGGSLSFTFDIPDALKGLRQIAIRLQSNTGSGYFAYNWFYNNTTGGTGGPSGYYGFPTFTITSVVRNTSVTILTNNLPPGDQFDVLMGPMGTRGLNGYYVTTFDSGGGGVQTLSFDIPAQLAGSHRISIRLQSASGSGYYAYNWFYNNTTP